jgi:hypothetical protein
MQVLLLLAGQRTERSSLQRNFALLLSKGCRIPHTWQASALIRQPSNVSTATAASSY